MPNGIVLNRDRLVRVAGDREDLPARIQPKIRRDGESRKAKLDHLHAATSLADLAAVPGNRLEALRGDHEGQYSIRINEQWRICFAQICSTWPDGEAFAVEIVDYH
jgi:toxin HigB-1